MVVKIARENGFKKMDLRLYTPPKNIIKELTESPQRYSKTVTPHKGGGGKPQRLFEEAIPEEWKRAMDNLADDGLREIARAVVPNNNDFLANALLPLLSGITLKKFGIFSGAVLGLKYLYDTQHDRFINALSGSPPSPPSPPPTPPPSPEPEPRPSEEKKEKDKEDKEEDGSGDYEESTDDSSSKVDDTLLQKSFATVMGLRARAPKKRKLQPHVDPSSILQADPQWSRTENFLEPVNPAIIELATQNSAAPPFLLDRIDKMTSNAVRMLL